MKASGDWLDSRASNGSTTHWSTPQALSSVSLSRRVAMRAGASSGLRAALAKKSRGWGSKVSTQLGTPRWRASLLSRASMAWCPRCTPSKLPIVTAHASATPGWWKPRKICMGRRADRYRFDSKPRWHAERGAAKCHGKWGYIVLAVPFPVRLLPSEGAFVEGLEAVRTGAAPVLDLAGAGRAALRRR